MTSDNVLNSLTNPFWQFSIKVYQQEEVKSACLSFQNNEGLNVNLLLLCCWLAYAVEEVKVDEFRQGCGTIRDWHQKVTQTLRLTRQHLKSLERTAGLTDFYQKVLTNEISSESYQQQQLYLFFAHKQKSSVEPNEDLAYRYLSWLFADLNLFIDQIQAGKIRSFIRQVFQVSHRFHAIA